MNVQMPMGYPPQFGLPAQRPTSLYIGNLDEAVHEETLYSYFTRYGPIHSLKIVKDKNNGKSKGFGYINFINARDADSARMLANNEKVGKNPIRLMYKREQGPAANTVGNIFVKSIDPNATPKDLHAFFSTLGNVASVKIASDKEGQSLGYGYVQYEKAEDADRAVKELNNLKLKEAEIVIELFVPKSQRGGVSGPGRNLYIRNFPKNKTEEEIKALVNDTFSNYGSIESSLVKKYKDWFFAYVCFANHDDAVRAIEELNDKDLLGTGDKLLVTWHLTKAQRVQAAKNNTDFQTNELFIKNVKTTTTNDEVQKAFAQFGEIASIALKKPEKSPAGVPETLFGFITYKEKEDAKDAQSEGYKNAETRALFHNEQPYISFKQNKEQRDRFKQTVIHGHHRLPEQPKRTWNALPQYPPQPYPMGYGMPMMQQPRGQFPQKGMGAGMPNMPVGGQQYMQQQQQQPYDQHNQFQNRQNPRGRGGPISGRPGMGMGGPGNLGQRQGGMNQQPQQRPYMNQGPGGMRGGQPNRGGPAQKQGQHEDNQEKQQRPQQQQQQQSQQSEAPQSLTVSNLKNKLDEFLKLDAEKQRNILGELLYPKILDRAGNLYAPKVTGMLVDFDVLTVPDILEMLEDDSTLHERIDEAIELIKQEGEN